jgi:VanZ family protein
MDFETIDHSTPRCIQATPYGPQANIRVTPPVTRPKYIAKITKNGHFRVYLGLGRSGSKWILGLLTIIHSDASGVLTKALRGIFALLPR